MCSGGFSVVSRSVIGITPHAQVMDHNVTNGGPVVALDFLAAHRADDWRRGGFAANL